MASYENHPIVLSPVPFLNRNRALSPRVDIVDWKLFGNQDVKGPTSKRCINTFFFIILFSLLVCPLALDEGGEVNVLLYFS